MNPLWLIPIGLAMLLAVLGLAWLVPAIRPVVPLLAGACGSVSGFGTYHGAISPLLDRMRE